MRNDSKVEKILHIALQISVDQPYRIKCENTINRLVILQIDDKYLPLTINSE